MRLDAVARRAGASAGGLCRWALRLVLYRDATTGEPTVVNMYCSSSVGDVEHFSSIFVDVYEDKCFFAKTSAFLFRKKNYAQKYVHVNINILMCSYILNIILVICKKKSASVMIGSSICFHTKYIILFLTMWFL